MSFAVLTGVMFFVAFAIVHLAVPRLSRNLGRGSMAVRLTPLFLLAIALIILAVWATGKTVPASPIGAAASILLAELTFLSLFVLYMPALYTVTHSLSVATLVMLRRSPESRLSKARLMQTFASQEFAAARLAAMVESGYIAKSSPPYRLCPRGKVVARAFLWLQRVWRLGPGG